MIYLKTVCFWTIRKPVLHVNSEKWWYKSLLGDKVKTMEFLAVENGVIFWDLQKRYFRLFIFERFEANISGCTLSCSKGNHEI